MAAISVEPTPLGLLLVLVAILTPYFLPWTLTGLKFAIPTIWVISKFSRFLFPSVDAPTRCTSRLLRHASAVSASKTSFVLPVFIHEKKY